MGLFDFLKRKKAVSNNDVALEDILLFDELDGQIEKYNKLSDYLEKRTLYKEIYAQIVKLETDGKIARERKKKPISYLEQILQNDGPEYIYTIKFWPIWDNKRKYEIGVCVRGNPLLRKLN